MAEDYSQQNRPIRVYLEGDSEKFLIRSLEGVEGISQPFHFDLELLSKDLDIDPATVLRKRMVVELYVTDEANRYINGVVNRFALVGIRDELAYYRVEIVPWLWFLDLPRECRIFHDMKVEEIATEIFQRAGYSDFKFRLTGNHPVRKYCVEYRESPFAFISRLLEEEGIFYYFEHTDERHMLMLSDNSSGSKPIVGPENLRYTTEEHPAEYVISSFEREHRVYPGQVRLGDYDFERPSYQVQEKLGDKNEEVYDFPGGFRAENEGGELRARAMLEAEEARRQLVSGNCNTPGVTPCHYFTLSEHFQESANGKYLLTQIRHKAQAGEFRGWAADTEIEYRVEFRAIPEATPFRPRRNTRKPLIHGSQSAEVVSGSTETIDEYGRIKVRFYWDADDRNSCWIRVATPWAGNGWGAVSIPRVGNEVLVAFEEGDPDRPIVIGSVYNANNMPPFALPDKGIQQGMKTQTPSSSGFNEISMTDTAGKELINIHGQHDMVIVVQNDVSETIVKGKRTLSIESGTNTTTVKGNDSHTVQAGDLTQDVTGNIKRKASADIDDHATGKVKTTGDAGVTITGSASGVTIKGTGGDGVGVDGTPNVKLKGAAAVEIEAPSVKVTGVAMITLTSGGSSISINPGQITISSPLVSVNGTALTEIKGGLVKVN